MAVIRGDDGPNTLIGTNRDDTIEAFAGDDTVFGNNHEDLIFGGAGNDMLYGNDGQDRIDGGSGDDRMIGGAGVDWLDYSQSPSGIFVDLTAQFANDGFGDMDQIAEFEHVEGSDFDDMIFAAEYGSILLGRRGDDQLVGRGLFNHLEGGMGDDLLIGSSGRDALIGQSGNDRLQGGRGDDYLDGGKKADVVLAGGGDDEILAGDEDEADDRLRGGGGNDLFVVSPKAGSDVIVDFESGEDSPFTDVIDLSAMPELFDRFADVVSRSDEVGGDLVIDLDGVNTLTLKDTEIEELDAGHFVFG